MRRWRMGSYSKDLRLKVLAATERGTPRREVVETFGVSLATLKRWLKKRREGEDLSPKSSTGRKRRILSSAEQKRALCGSNSKPTTKRPLSATARIVGTEAGREGVHRHDEPGHTP
jgi:transposase